MKTDHSRFAPSLALAVGCAGLCWYLLSQISFTRHDSLRTPDAALEEMGKDVSLLRQAYVFEERQSATAMPFKAVPEVEDYLQNDQKMFVLEGRVANKRGEAIADCLVTTNAWHSPEARTSASGDFRLELPFTSGSTLPTSLAYCGPRTPASSLTLAISAEEQFGLRAYREVAAEDGHLVTVRVTDGELDSVSDVLVSLVSGEREVGTLARFDKAGLLAQDWRRARAQKPCGWGVTDDNGSVAIALLPGVYRVEAWKSGFLPFESADLAVPCLGEVHIQLGAGKVAAGIIRSNGRPLDGADVCIKDNGRKNYFTRTNEAGEFSIGGLSGDEVDVLAWQVGFPICRWDRKSTETFCELEMCTVPELLVYLVDATTQQRVLGPANVSVVTGKDVPPYWLNFSRSLDGGALALLELGSYANSVVIKCPGYETVRIEKSDFQSYYGKVIPLMPLGKCRIVVKEAGTGMLIARAALNVNRVQWDDSDGARRASQDMFGLVEVPFLFVGDRVESSDEVTLEVSCNGYLGQSVVLREPGEALPNEMVVELVPMH